MATTIQIKRSSTASAVPLAGDLEVGELAVNLADKRLFTKKSDGTVVELSTNPTDIDIATLRIDGVEVTASAAELNSLDGSTATAADLNKLAAVTATSTELNVLDGFTGSTAELNFVDGVTSNIQTQLDNKQPLDAQLTDIAGLTPTDGTFIVGNGTNFVAESGDTAIASLGVTATATELNVLDGITATTTELNYTDGVTSNIQTQLDAMVEKAGDTMTGDLSLGDNVKAKFGASDDLQIYHSGSHSFVSDTGTGRLYLQGTDGVRVTNASAVNMISAVSGDGVYSYYNGSLKLATTATGVDVTGTVTADGLTVTSGSPSGTLASLKGSSGFGFTLSSDATAPYIQTIGVGGGEEVAITSGGKKLALFEDGGNVHLYEDTGTTAKMVWDASAEGLSIGGTALGKFNVSDGTNPLVVDCNATYNEIQSYNRPLQINRQGNNTILNSTGGNVGIGTASPSNKLTISDSNSTNGTKVSVNVQSTDVSATNNASFSLYEVGTEYGRFQRARDGSGTVKLTALGTQHLSLETLGTGVMYFKTNNSEAMRIDSSGNLLVGTTTGNFSAKFVVENSSSYTFLSRRTGTGSEGHIVFQNANGAVGTIFTNGSTTSYNTSSDERLKENIQDTTHTVDINDIRVREFDWKVDGEHQRFGFIAQELETVYPEAVSTDDSEEQMKSVDYSKLVPLLVKEIQTLKSRIETLENN